MTGWYGWKVSALHIAPNIAWSKAFRNGSAEDLEGPIFLAPCWCGGNDLREAIIIHYLLSLKFLEKGFYLLSGPSVSLLLVLLFQTLLLFFVRQWHSLSNSRQPSQGLAEAQPAPGDPKYSDQLSAFLLEPYQIGKIRQLAEPRKESDTETARRMNDKEQYVGRMSQNCSAAMRIAEKRFIYRSCNSYA